MSTTHPRPRNSFVEYDTTPPPPRRELTAVLVLAAVFVILSMPLAWHHRDIPGDGYVTVHGFEGANWLLVIAVLAVGMGARFYTQPTGFYSKWLATLVAFATTLGVFGEYIDNQSQAGQLHVDAYFGPGFFVGLVAAGLLVVSAVLAWRGAETL